MEFDYWWVLAALPIFFGFGWIAARIDIKQLMHESRALPRSYFEGLNFLLNEKQDKAIESFIEAARVDPETVEIHFALGSLFRRRGEVDRAIQVHQNLIDRDGLRADQRLYALSELGQDFLKAGLLDRAEAVFLKLRGTERDDDALANLLEIFQQEKEWKKAIEIAQAMPTHSDHLWHKEIAQFRCELAAVEILNERFDEAKVLLETALADNRKCVRATILLGDVAAKSVPPVGAGDKPSATLPIEIWKRVEQQNPDYLALVAQKLMQAYTELGRADQGLNLLRDYLARYSSLDMLDAVFEAELQSAGAEAAYVLVRDELRRNQTLLGLDKLLQAQLLVAPQVSPERQGDLELVKNLIHTHTRRVARYRCDTCGFKARQFYWRCPGCGSWESYPPRRSEEFDITP
ncbi:MAG: lipopolysaccharide assembly protein LapB [Rhodocyclaceae bacterium]|nr:lipopolysaccharide assembly protein LapB [Rhodocyclaceae bacterium]